MKLYDILGEKFSLGKTVNTADFTFGFEIEFYIKSTWAMQSYPISIENMSYDEIKEYFDWDDEVTYDYIEKYGSLMIAWNNGIDITEGAHLKSDDVFWENGQIYDPNKLGQSDAYYALREWLAETIGDYTVIVGDEKDENKDYSKWYIESDASLDSYRTDYGAEITSPVFENYDDFKNTLTNLLTKIREDNIGFTDSRCGLHINIGTKKPLSFDYVKLAVFLGEEYLRKLFERYGSSESIASHIDTLFDFELDQTKFNQNFDQIVNELNEIFKHSFEGDKSFVFNHLPHYEGKNYIEFRAIGGKNYEKNILEIVQHINRFVYTLRLSATDYKKQEYMKKIYKLIYPNENNKDFTILLRKAKEEISNDRYFDKFIKNGKITDDIIDVFEVIYYLQFNDSPMKWTLKTISLSNFTSKDINRLKERLKNIGLIGVDINSQPEYRRSNLKQTKEALQTLVDAIESSNHDRNPSKNTNG
ncbi:MAG: amidoligase family protein [Candidimonas sp.]